MALYKTKKRLWAIETLKNIPLVVLIGWFLEICNYSQSAIRAAAERLLEEVDTDSTE